MNIDSFPNFVFYFLELLSCLHLNIQANHIIFYQVGVTVQIIELVLGEKKIFLVDNLLKIGVI